MPDHTALYACLLKATAQAIELLELRDNAAALECLTAAMDAVENAYDLDIKMLPGH